MAVVESKILSEAEIGEKVEVVNVGDDSASFLKYLDKQGVALGDTITVKEIQDFDKSILVELKGKKEISFSAEAAKILLVV